MKQTEAGCLELIIGVVAIGVIIYATMFILST